MANYWKGTEKCVTDREAAVLFGPAVGDIKWVACNETPIGWLLCDGREVSRTDFADLFAVIGVLWGEGDGESTFNLPNLIDKTVWGGSDVGGYKEAGLPNIEGTFPTASWKLNTITGAFYFTGSTGEQDGDSSGTNGRIQGFDASRSNAIYGASSTVQPPAAILRPYIRASLVADPSQQVGTPMTREEVLILVDEEVPNAIQPYLESKAETDLTNISTEGKDTAVSWGMPDYSAKVSLAASTTSYTAPQDGFIILNAGGYNSRLYAYIDNQEIAQTYSQYPHATMYPIAKGSVFSRSGGNPITSLCFIPAKGV